MANPAEPHLWMNLALVHKRHCIDRLKAGADLTVALGKSFVYSFFTRMRICFGSSGTRTMAPPFGAASTSNT